MVGLGFGRYDLGGRVLEMGSWCRGRKNRGRQCLLDLDLPFWVRLVPQVPITQLGELMPEVSVIRMP
jgi:hypothetical protein